MDVSLSSLRDDYVQHRLPLAQSQRARRFRLPRIHRLDTAAQTLCDICARIDAESKNSRQFERKSTNRQNRKRHNKQLQRHRRAADDGEIDVADDVGDNHSASALLRRDLDDGDDGAEHKPEQRRSHRDDERRAEPLEHERNIFGCGENLPYLLKQHGASFLSKKARHCALPSAHFEMNFTRPSRDVGKQAC